METAECPLAKECTELDRALRDALTNTDRVEELDANFTHLYQQKVPPEIVRIYMQFVPAIEDILQRADSLEIADIPPTLDWQIDIIRSFAREALRRKNIIESWS